MYRSRDPSMVRVDYAAVPLPVNVMHSAIPKVSGRGARLNQ